MKNKILFGIIGLAILVLGGWAISQKPTPGNVAVTPPVTTPLASPVVIPPAPTSTTSPTEYEELSFPENHLDTSDWLTYRNEEFGFEVKYPKGWDMRKIVCGKDFMGDCGEYKGSVLFYSLNNPYDDAYLPSFGIRVYKLGLEEILSKGANFFFPSDASIDNTLPKKRNIKVNNIFGVYFIPEKSSGQYVDKYVLGNTNDSFSFYFDRNDKDMLVLQQMLLSFRSLR